MEWKNGNEKKEKRETEAKWCERTHVRQGSLENNKNKNKKYHLEKERVIRMKLEREKEKD